MAGTKNIFNADPLDTIYEALVRTHGLSLRREEIAMEIVSQTAQHTRVRLTPQLSSGTTIYVNPVEYTIRKLNLSGRMPRDMSYSGDYPLTLEGLDSFFGASYGLDIRSGEWSLRRNGSEAVVDETFLSNGEIDVDRVFYLRPTAQHPLLEANSFELRVMITEPLILAT